MPRLENKFELFRCPHCSVHRPMLSSLTEFNTKSHNGGNRRTWRCYVCGNCGGVVLAAAYSDGDVAYEIYPQPQIVDETIPERARTFLEQAINSIHAPAGSVMLSASAVDAMLKEKGYNSGSLYKRIEKAAEDHLITQSMAEWAHEVRLDANDQRHADENADLPNEKDAQRVIDFVTALAQFLFVLPNRVQRGIAATK